MAYRPVNRVEFEERDTYISDRGPRGRRASEVDIYERREERRAPSRGPPVRERERDFDELDVRIRGREHDWEAAFLREENRRLEPGQLVLRKRDVEEFERRRRSPSPPAARVREMRITERGRSQSPGSRRREEDIHIRSFSRERVRSPSRGPPVERIRTRYVEREMSPSPHPAPRPVERVRTRLVERNRSPSPIEERERIRIVERRRELSPTPAPKPPPPSPPAVIKGPTIEREVITHYRDIDHGVIQAPKLMPASPSLGPRRRERDTEIDIHTSRDATEVDIHRSKSRGRARSPSRERLPPPRHHHDDEVILRSDRHHLSVEYDEHEGRRSHSAQPFRLKRTDYDNEAEVIMSKITSRGRMGEGWGGATKDWTIVDVPPGTERVRMDGAGGGQAEVSWQKYSGVRRAKFIPERDRDEDLGSSTSDGKRSNTRDRERHLSVQIYDDDCDKDVERGADRRISIHRSSSPAPLKRSEMWTEITKDLVAREAIQELGYEFEETEYFFYIMQYLRYEDVLELVKVSEKIRRARKERIREIQHEREIIDDWEPVERHHGGRRRGRNPNDRYDEERVFEQEILFERQPVKGYLR